MGSFVLLTGHCVVLFVLLVVLRHDGALRCPWWTDGPAGFASAPSGSPVVSCRVVGGLVAGGCGVWSFCVLTGHCVFCGFGRLCSLFVVLFVGVLLAGCRPVS